MNIQGQLNLEYWEQRLATPGLEYFVSTDAGYNDELSTHVMHWPATLTQAFQLNTGGKKGNGFCLLLATLAVALYKCQLDNPVVSSQPLAKSGHQLLFVPQVDGQETIENLVARLKNQLVEGSRYLPIVRDAISEGKYESAVRNTSVAFEGFTDVSPASIDSCGFCLAISGNETLTQTIYYRRSVFQDEFILSFAEGFVTLLTGFLANMQLRVNACHFASSNSRMRTQAFNQTQKDVRHTTLLQLFDEQCAQHSDRIAIVHGAGTLTYRELSQKVSSLAAVLQSLHNIHRGDVVGVMLERSELMIISILAILKCGAAYLPIDPETPESRINFIAVDASSKIVITAGHKVSGLNNLDISKGWPQPLRFNEVTVAPSDVAYVIFTSGSTGTPKGVMIEHAGAVNRIAWMWAHYEFTDQDVILQKTTYVFDVSVWEIFMPLCFGARLVLCDRAAVFESSKLAMLIQTHQVSTIHFVPSLLDNFLKDMSPELLRKLASLKKVFTSGEALSARSATKLLSSLQCELHNLYGPTEASVDVTYYKVGDKDVSIPIGRPIWNMQIHVLDRDLEILPEELAGEIVLSGIGLARGYINRPELTHEKFRIHSELGRIYRTGDIGKISDGELHYISRADSQVKINGHRIELGEIENTILEVSSIARAVVDVKRVDGDEPILIAFVVPAAGKTIDLVALRDKVRGRLPAHMTPGFFQVTESIPVSTTGKTDVKKLMASFDARQKERPVYTRTPLTASEERLLDIWRIVLRRDDITVDDDFFAIGGTSLKVIELRNQIEKEFKSKVEAYQLFSSNTIQRQALLLVPDRPIQQQETHSIREIEI